MQATVSNTLAGSYDFVLVAASVLIAIVASYAALDLGARITTAQNRVRSLWLAGGSLSMGLGIWAMHYIGMLAFRLPVPVLYNWPTVLLSLLAAILASAVALTIVSRPTMSSSITLLGSVFMGTGIAAMHYIGMAAMRLPADCVYSPSLVTLSIFLAIAISYLALRLTFSFRESSAAWGRQKLFSGLIMGLAIPIMHYVGMAAVTFTSMSYLNGSTDHTIGVSGLGLTSIAITTLVVLGLVFLTSAIDRQFALRNLQLAESRTQMQAIFDNMAESVLVLDLEGNTKFANGAAKRPASMKDGKRFIDSIETWFEIFSKEGKPLLPDQRPANRALRGDFVRNFEVLLRNKLTGETGVREVSTVPILDRHGATTQIIITSRDTTEQRKSDEAKSRLAAIVESSEDAIIGKDTLGNITSWNEGAQNIFGYSAVEMLGQSIKQLLPPDRIHEEDEILQLILSDQSVDHFDTIRRKKDGKFIHVSLSISPIKDATGKVIGASKIARDITERKNLEQQLLASQKMEAIGQLTGGIAHDFNNLLGIIIGNLDLLDRHIDGNADAQKRLLSAQKATVRGADLTRRLLAFSSSQELNPVPASLNESIQTMIDLATRILGPDIKIATFLEPALPLILVDVAGLESALLNLFVNARDAMPRGGALTITTLRSDLDATYPAVLSNELKSGPYACISVSDTGHGMSQDTMEHAFEPFFTTKVRGKGTGLGLAMVYGFAKQSGGIARIYSELGLGTTVSLFLPVAVGLAAPNKIFQQPLNTVERQGVVLVVDDEDELTEIALVYLAEMGYTPLRAKDGKSALKIIEHHREIDLVLTDIVMPGGMSGIELAQKIRQQYPSIRIAYSSGFPADALAEKTIAPIDGPLLRKPYLRAEFASLMQRAMEKNYRPPSTIGELK